MISGKRPWTRRWKTHWRQERIPNYRLVMTKEYLHRWWRNIQETEETYGGGSGLSSVNPSNSGSSPQSSGFWWSRQQLRTECHVRVNKQAILQTGKSPDPLGSCDHQDIIFSSIFFYFYLKKLKKYDSARPKVPKYSLTSWPELIVVFHGEYKRTVTHTLNFQISLSLIIKW